MFRPIFGLILLLCSLNATAVQTTPTDNSQSTSPLGAPGLTATYRIAVSKHYPESVIITYTAYLGSIEEINGTPHQWFHLRSSKVSGETLNVWLLSNRYPSPSLNESRSGIARYLVREGTGDVVEYKHRYTGEAVLPCLGAWEYLFPHAVDSADRQDGFPKETSYLGHTYRLEKIDRSAIASVPNNPLTLDLLPDVLVGVPHNTRQKDETRRWDESEYEYVRLTRNDFGEMIDAGMNCFFVDREQSGWIEHRNVFYWGIGGQDIQFPEHLYRSHYLGPQLFLDEPAVCTRDYVIRPRLKEEPEFRKSITPQTVLEEFKEYFAEAQNKKNPTQLIQGLKARSDVDLGNMSFLQQNLYTWETMVSTAAFQLGDNKSQPPSSIVFEPPGHLGTLRTLPEMNMAYLCQIPVDNPKNFIEIVYGFLRGAARNSDKEWGTSIYGAVDRADAFWFMTHAYDLGAQKFFFWDNAQLACVPFQECLALSRNLKAHVENHPYRNGEQLKQVAEVAILLPPGYDLGHVHMGKGLLWGLEELNLERKNRHGIPYRTVMGNFFTEIERCIRLGVAYDLLWDLPELNLSGYREIVRIREDGQVEIIEKDKKELLSEPRTPVRPIGEAPKLEISLSTEQGKVPLKVTAYAVLTEGSAPVYYTPGPDTHGVFHNVKVFWELYGPGEEDYRALISRTRPPSLQSTSEQTVVEFPFQITQPGRYRLRAAACDLAGRTTVMWKEITVEE